VAIDNDGCSDEKGQDGGDGGHLISVAGRALTRSLSGKAATGVRGGGQ
jgi:hypothetical protein